MLDCWMSIPNLSKITNLSAKHRSLFTGSRFWKKFFVFDISFLQTVLVLCSHINEIMFYFTVSTFHPYITDIVSLFNVVLK